MKKLILVTMLFFLGSNVFAQTNSSDSLFVHQYKIYKELEIRQINSEIVLRNYFWEFYSEGYITGRNVALKYIDFAENSIKKWEIVLENPDIIFADATTLDIVEFVKALTPDNLNADQRVELLKEKIKEKIQKHIDILRKDIVELKTS